MKSGSTKLRELVNIIQKSDSYPSNIRLFVITDENYIRMYRKKISITNIRNTDIFEAKYLKCDRGSILDIFSKIEFLVNEIIILKVLGFKLKGEVYDKSLMLDDILDNIDLSSRVKILKKWQLINNNLKELLMQTRKVRNWFAHVWDIDDIDYHKKKIKENFPKFKEDISNICSQLLDIYRSLQDKIDFETLIDKIKSFQLNKE